MNRTASRDPSCHYHLRKLAGNRWTFDLVMCTSPHQYQRPQMFWAHEQDALAAAKHQVTEVQVHTPECTMRYVNRHNNPQVMAYDAKLSEATRAEEHPLKNKPVLAHVDE
jgi:hypothetical protein